MTLDKLKNILEAVLLSADHPLAVPQMDTLFSEDEDRPTRDEIRKALHELGEEYAARGFELKQVASGFRLQVKQDFAPWVSRLWEEKPARYTRALLETMALIAYRQPVTRGEIEEVRGVSVSSNIIRTLEERQWIRVLGHKDVPGKPALYGTTREFLDYFNLSSLDDLPSLAEIRDLDKIYPELALEDLAANDATEGRTLALDAEDDVTAAGETETEVEAEAGTDTETETETEVKAEAEADVEAQADTAVDSEVAEHETHDQNDHDDDDFDQDEAETIEKSAASS